MSAKNNLGSLTEEEIEEEILNNDLINVGVVENVSILNSMDLEEKKDLLRGIEQSKEGYQSELFTDLGSTVSNSSKIDVSSPNFPSLPTPGKSNMRTNKLKLPRKQLPTPKEADSDDSSDRSICLFDAGDIGRTMFILPFCINDDAPPLPTPNRPRKRNKNPYYTMKGESPINAYKRMLLHHEKWKAAYKAEMNKIELNNLKSHVEDLDSVEPRDSPKAVEVKESDPYTFVSNSPVQNTKTFKGTNLKENNTGSYDNDKSNTRQPRTIQRKTSRDSDCEEVGPILKPEAPKLGEWIQTGTRRQKRNRKQMGSQDKNKSMENNSNVEFDFDNKWESGTATWQSPQSSSSSSLNNQGRRNISNATVIQEEKVECPICQRSFARTKVENHASNCEGYLGSPMDVEEGS